MAARQATSTALRFEVASIKTYPPDERPQGPVGGLCRGVDTRSTGVPLGHCLFRYVNLKQLILQAFPPSERPITADNLTSGNGAGFPDVSARIRIMSGNEWVTGGPSWIERDFFEVDAKAEDPATVTQQQLRQMLQTMVTERFKLTFHLAAKSVDAYFIVPAEGGSKLRPVSGEFRGTGVPPNRGGSGIAPFPLQQGTLTQLGLILSQQLKMPVITKIDIPGRWDFSDLNGVDMGLTTAGSDSAVGSVFTAVREKLGLKLEPQKITVDVFVVDRAERPSQN